MFNLKLALALLGLATFVTANVTSEADPPTSESQPEDRVVGGQAAYILDFPYQVSLQLGGNHFCGGSILNSRVIITAAHCIEAVPDPLYIKIRYGSAYWKVNGTVVGVEKVLVHPSYNTDNHQFDLALVKTKNPIVWSDKAKNIALPTALPPTGATAKISGWGTLQSGASTIPDRLQWATVKIVSQTDCQSDKYSYSTAIKNTMICAAEANIDTCQGDSGGPLVVNGALVGVVSWGKGCARPAYPGVYASTFLMQKFISNFKTM